MTAKHFQAALLRVFTEPGVVGREWALRLRFYVTWAASCALRNSDVRALSWRSIWVEHYDTNPYSLASIGPDPSFAVNLLAGKTAARFALGCSRHILYKSAVECSQNLWQQEVLLAARRFSYRCQCSPACKTCGNSKCCFSHADT